MGDQAQAPHFIVILEPCESMDGEPCVTANVYGDGALAWAKDQGSIDGSSWEGADGDDFAYTILFARLDLVEDLEADGYEVDAAQVDLVDLLSDDDYQFHGALCAFCKERLATCESDCPPGRASGLPSFTDEGHPLLYRTETQRRWMPDRVTLWDHCAHCASKAAAFTPRTTTTAVVHSEERDAYCDECDAVIAQKPRLRSSGTAMVSAPPLER